MIQRFILAVQESNFSDSAKHNVLSSVARDTTSGFLTTAKHLFVISGLIAMTILALMFIKPELTDKFRDLSPFAEQEEASQEEVAPPSLATLMQAPGQVSTNNTANNAAPSDEEIKMLGNQRQQQWVTHWLAKRYRVASDATNMLVSAAYLTAKEIKLDPLLILSVMAIESGLNPFAESPVGAQGLMQVMSKVHHDKFQELGGVKAALNPVANIKVGALILKDYVSRAGSVEAGLKLYVGAAAFDNDSGYGSRVMSEYKRLKDVSAGKNVPTFFTAPPAPASVKPVEAATSHKTDSNEAKTVPVDAKKEQVAAL
ncbi:transglycosylase SLT domain-containing protein [Undibacterium sp. SXout7W]|uniref:transglycosylase SLT domain-containing protein n=1 Tax=Undibacterium sp. SXout7W TaxID=3413049 RepID=UPI003BF1BB13